jgi:hypothetical protein
VRAAGCHRSAEAVAVASHRKLPEVGGVLDFHKIINTEEKRCGVEALGAEMVGKLSYYERWIVAFANILFRKGILTPTGLALKMGEVEARWPKESRAG